MKRGDQQKRAGCSLSALRQCHCIGRAAGPNCRFWSEDLDGDIARANERTAAELVIECGVEGLTLRNGDGLRLNLVDGTVHVFRDDDAPALLRGQIPARVICKTPAGVKGLGDGR